MEINLFKKRADTSQKNAEIRFETLIKLEQTRHRSTVRLMKVKPHTRLTQIKAG